MKDWILRLRIKYKLIFAFGSILVLSMMLMGLGIFTIQRILGFQELQSQASRLKNNALQLESDVNAFTFEGVKDPDFLSTGSSSLTQSIYRNLDTLSIILSELDEAAVIDKEGSSNLFSDVSGLHDQFNQLIQLYQERGFKDAGLEGELRSAIHAVEDRDYPYDRAMMLMLRRHEKDFFLRKDLKYVDKFHDDHDKFLNAIAGDGTEDEAAKKTIQEDLDVYLKKFDKLVGIEQAIGMTNDQGISGKLNKRLQSLLNGVDRISSHLHNEASDLVGRSLLLLIILVLIQFAIGSVLAWVYANIMTKAVDEVRSSLTDLSKGNFPDKLKSRTKDELADLKSTLNLLVDRIRTAVEFSTAIGQGQLELKYKDEYRDDVLAVAITDMQDKLRKAEERQRIINWANEGIARLGNHLHEESSDTEVLGRKILQSIVSHVDLNQAALYLLNEKGDELHRVATYAYGKQRFEEHIVPVENGLIGQALKEHTPIYLKEVPNNYTRITSGLGEATPGTVFIVPLEVRGQGVGVLELATFHEIEEYQKEFLLRACDTIAAAIRTRQMTEETKRLLEQTEEKAQTLSAQEEELRQNTEELVATQEEMQRQRSEMETTIESLKQQINLREKEIRSLMSTS